MDFGRCSGMRMNRRLALYHAVGKALCFFCGAVSETLTIQQDGVTVATAATNANGITETAVELKKGTYSILGSVSGYEKTGVVIDGDGTYNAYPDGAVFWFGNGDTEGDTLWSKCGGWKAANISYASGSRTTPSLSVQNNLVQGSLSGIGSTSGYYGTVYMNNAVDVSKASRLRILNARTGYNGRAVSRIGVVSGSAIAQGYAFAASADITSTSFVETALDVSALSQCMVANSLFAKYYGGNGAVTSQIKAVWWTE